ncbi:MAG: hypothetical protein L0Y55_02705 [Anaerolineales bacterium]|nr:hypothetical protein [Anaerolineales bacterium]
MEQQRTIAFSEDGLQKIQERIEDLRLDLGAVVALLLDDSGQLLTDCGWHGDFDINAFLALVGNEMSAANAVVHLLRDDAAFDLHFHEGQKYEMYTARITDQIFLTLIFESRLNASGRVGMVWLTLRRAIAELRKQIQRASVKPGTAEDREMHNAINATLGEALSRIEDDPLLFNPKADAPRPSNPKSDVPPASAPTPDPPRRRTRWSTPNPLPPAEPPPPPITPPPPAERADSNRVLSYEEARALGLIGADDATENARENG